MVYPRFIYYYYWAYVIRWTALKQLQTLLRYDFLGELLLRRLNIHCNHLPDSLLMPKIWWSCCSFELLMIPDNFNLRSFSTILRTFLPILIDMDGSYWLSWACCVFSPCTFMFKFCHPLFDHAERWRRYNSYLIYFNMKRFYNGLNFSFLHLFKIGNKLW